MHEGQLGLYGDRKGTFVEAEPDLAGISMGK